MLSEFQSTIIGECKFCGGEILWNEDERKSIFNPQQPDCYCEMEEDVMSILSVKELEKEIDWRNWMEEYDE